MYSLSNDQLRRLVEQERVPCASVYMPTIKAGPETMQNPIRFKNLLRTVRTHPLVQALSESESDDLLGPAEALAEDLHFWQHQEEGLALFLAPGLFWHMKLPHHVDELAVVTGSFHLKPLLPLLSEDGRFHILALSLGRVRFFRASRYEVEERNPPALPGSMEDALSEYEEQKQLQFQTGAQSRRGRRPAMFHGHGAPKEDEKERILEYFRKVDQALQDELQTEQGPLVLTGVDYLLPIYAKANTYPGLLEESVPGNPEHLQAETIHEKTLPLLEDTFLRERREAVSRYEESLGTGLASAQLDRIVPAAVHGRVDCLFVALGVQRWGTFDPDTNSVSLHSDAREGGRDLLDLAAVHAFLNRGRVHALPPSEMPGNEEMCAVFRY